MHTYLIKFRHDGMVSQTTVMAYDPMQARKLVIAQYGDGTVIMTVKRA